MLFPEQFILHQKAKSTGWKGFDVFAVVKDSLVILGLLVWLLWENWRLTLVTLTVGPVIVLIVAIGTVVMRRERRCPLRVRG